MCAWCGAWQFIQRPIPPAPFPVIPSEPGGPEQNGHGGCPARAAGGGGRPGPQPTQSLRLSLEHVTPASGLRGGRRASPPRREQRPEMAISVNQKRPSVRDLIRFVLMAFRRRVVFSPAQRKEEGESQIRNDVTRLNAQEVPHACSVIHSGSGTRGPAGGLAPLLSPLLAPLRSAE